MHESESLCFTIEVARTEHADDPHAFRFVRQTYNLRTAGGGRELVEVPWDAALLADLAALRHSEPDPAIVARVGDVLRRILQPTGWTAMARSIAAAADAGRRVVVTFQFNAAELYALPWELVTLAAGGAHLGAREAVLVRYAWPETATRRPPVEPRPAGGRVLLAWSAAGGQVPAGEHVAAIAGACRSGQVEFDAGRDVVAHASTDAIVAALASATAVGDPVAVLHVLCHGGAAGSTFGLVLDGGADGEPVVVDAGHLRRVLEPFAGTLQLVVLAACDGGNVGALGNHLGSVAQSLHRAGFAAVVASRLPLSVVGSVELARTFYRTLLEGPASLETAFLAARTRLAADPRRLDWASIQLHAREADGDDGRPIVFRPYRGLLTFEARHTRFFFGRDAERAELLGDLHALEASGRARVLVVAGASGTGKSSMVLAGAVPDLLAAGRPGRRVVVLRPGADPLAALRSALVGHADRTDTLLLVVDQFEEVFTQTEDPAARGAFVRELWNLGLARDSRVSVLLTIRVDFLGQCGELTLDDQGLRLDRVAYDEAHRVFVAQMGGSQLLRAIEEPARKVGLRLEAGLAARMLADVEGEPGALPAMSYALDLLWQQRSGRTLTQATYVALGGVSGALHGKADALVEGLDAAHRLQVRRLLVRLVGVAVDGAADTRRRVEIDRLRPGRPEQARAFDAVLGQLVDARLLVRGEAHGTATIEVAHEALIRRWPRLRGWIQDDLEMLAQVAEVEGWVAHWRTYATLLKGDQLGYALRVRDKYREDLRADALTLIAASEAERTAGEVARATQARRTRRRLLAVTTAVSATAVVMAGLGIWGFAASRSAEEKANEAAAARRDAESNAEAAARARQDAESKAAEASAAAESARTASLMAGTRELLARDRADTAAMLLAMVKQPERTRGWLPLAIEVLARPIPTRTLRHASGVLSAVWSPDDLRIATACDDGTVRVWSVDGSLTPRVLASHAGLARTVAWSPDGKRLVTASSDMTAWVLDVDGPGEPIILEGHEGLLASAAWSPDGTRIVTASNDRTAGVWNADGSGEPLIVELHEGAVWSAAWSPDGKRILTGSEDGVAAIWNADGSGRPITYQAHAGDVRAAEWSPDGQRVVSSHFENVAHVWRVDGSGEAVVLAGHTNVVQHATWSPDGARIVTASPDTTARVWNADGSGASAVRAVGAGQFRSAEWSHDGRRLLTASSDGTARVWRADSPGDRHVLAGHTSGLYAAVWSPDGRRIVTASVDGTARVWDADDPGASAVLAGHADEIRSAAWSPDGRRIVTASADKTARVWSGDGSGQPLVLKGHKAAVHAAAWSPDGRRIVTTSADRTVRVWDADAPGQPRVLTGHTAAVWSAAWSADGRRIVTAADDGTARVWNADGADDPVIIEGIEDNPGLASASWSPDGERIAVTFGGMSALLKNSDGSGADTSLGGHLSPVRAVAWSPDGRRVLTAADDATARVWSVDGASVGAALKGHKLHILSAAWSPDGRRIVTASVDHTARVWDVDGGGDPGVLTGHTALVTSARWSPDGKRVVTASNDGTARIWTVDFAENLRYVRAATTDCLPPGEREQYLAESASAACEGYTACERDHGRTTPDDACAAG